MAAITDALSQAGHRLSRTGSTLFGARGDDRSGGHGEREASQGTQRPKKKGGLPGGGKAIGAFLISLFAFTIQTEAAQHVQQALGYRKPFLSLYLGHSSFIFLFPLYILSLRLAQPSIPLSHQFHLISLNLHWQLSAPTANLPRPAADSIRRRLSTLSMRSQHSLHDEAEVSAEDFDIEELQRSRRMKPPPARTTWSERRFGFNMFRLLRVFATLTVGLTVPALSWYSAVPLTTMADITTIYNTYAVWALVFSIWFLGEEWERRKVFSVLLACGGVVLVAYGGAEHRRRPREKDPSHTNYLLHRSLDATADFLQQRYGRRADGGESGTGGGEGGGTNALVGDLLAFFGAVTMAAYEMAFKVIGTLPDEDAQAERFGDRRSRAYSELDEDGEMRDNAEATGLLAGASYDDDAQPLARDAGTTAAKRASEEDEDSNEDADVSDAVPKSTERTAIWKALDGEGPNGRTASPSYQSMTPPVAPGSDSGDEADEGKSPSIRVASQAAAAQRQEAEHKALDEWIPPPMPFGMHPIIVTSGIGLVTFCTLWIGLPIANALGWEAFEAPSNLKTYLYLFIVAFSGIIFNACFSILLALWGPVLASVSCLLTTVLVFGADLLLGHDFRWISLLGCVSIVAGFGVLVSGGSLH